MRPLFHPSIDDVTVEAILYALSDPVRVAIFADIAGSNCSQNCTNFVNVNEKPIPKSTLSQHFKVLRESGLIHGERHGVEMQNTSRCTEIDQRFPGSLRPLSTPTTFSPVANHRPAIIPNGRLPGGVYAAKTEASVRASYQRPVALSETQPQVWRPTLVKLPYPDIPEADGFALVAVRL